MNTRLCAAIAAIALMFAIGSAAFACPASHQSAHKSSLTKLSYASTSNRR